MPTAERFSSKPRRPRPLALVAIALLHLLAIYALAKVFAPGTMADVERSVLESVTIFETTPETAPVDPEPDPGAAGEPGEDAVPKPVTAQPPAVEVAPPSPAPRASSTGDEVQSGARDSGDGTGAEGSGLGTGSGAGGGGRGAVAVKPSVRSGNLDQARDFPVPEGGRQSRFGKSVTVQFTVTTDGRARGCSVLRTSVDSETTARVCPLVIEKIRFNPARDSNGNAIEARYGYRVDFNSRR